MSFWRQEQNSWFGRNERRLLVWYNTSRGGVSRHEAPCENQLEYDGVIVYLVNLGLYILFIDRTDLDYPCLTKAFPPTRLRISFKRCSICYALFFSMTYKPRIIMRNFAGELKCAVTG